MSRNAPDPQRTGWLVGLVAGIAALVVACAPAAPPPATPAPKAAAPTATPLPKPTPTPEPPYYAGKTISWIVATTAGGGLDVYARLVSQYLPKHIPGKPNIIILNEAGAGGVVAMNTLYNKAKPDGLTFSLTSAGFNLSYLLGMLGEGAQFDLKDMPVIASTGNYIEQHVMPSVSGIKAPRELLTVGRPVRACGIGAGTFLTVIPAVLFDGLGVTPRPVYGYRGIREVNLGMERNECDVGIEDLAGYFGYVKERVDQRDYLVLYQSGMLDSTGKVVRYPAFAEFPTLLEFYEQVAGKPVTGKHEAALKSLIATAMAGKLMMLPPKTPPERVETLRAAFKGLRDDPEYRAAFKAQNKVDDPLLVGTEAERALKVVLETPKEIVDFIRGLEGLK